MKQYANGWNPRLRPSRQPLHGSLGMRTFLIAGKQVPLLGKQRLDPIDYRAHAGGTAQITVDDDPVFGRDFEDRRG